MAHYLQSFGPLYIPQQNMLMAIWCCRVKGIHLQKSDSHLDFEIQDHAAVAEQALCIEQSC